MANTILTLEHRIVIETLRKEKRSDRYIADFIGFSTTTIFNEIHRVKGTYQAQKAHEDYLEKASHRGQKSLLTSDIIQLENLPDKGIRRKFAAETRGKATQQGKSIEDCPEGVNKRLVFDHFKGDTVLSGKTKGQGVLRAC